MTAQNELQPQPIHTASVGKRMLQGGAIALTVIVLFLVSAGEGNPAWPKLWLVKPLFITPLSGAMGGVYYYFMDHLRSEGGITKVVAHIMSLIGYLIVLFMGIVLGLDGTYWD